MQETVRPSRLGPRGDGQHLAGLHHIDPVEADFAMVRGLRAIAAIFWASTSLDAEQARLLDVGHVMKFAMDGVCPRNQIKQGRIVDRDDFVERPIMPSEGGLLCVMLCASGWERRLASNS